MTEPNNITNSQSTAKVNPSKFYIFSEHGITEKDIPTFQEATRKLKTIKEYEPIAYIFEGRSRT